eukprot:scaffold6389_cov75-Phaeocystis_antarctica.AAC.6
MLFFRVDAPRRHRCGCTRQRASPRLSASVYGGARAAGEVCCGEVKRGKNVRTASKLRSTTGSNSHAQLAWQKMVRPQY